MTCLKCGKETMGNQVFCDSCLQIMELHPVKPGTAIHLPRRSEHSAAKKARKRGLSADEQIALLKKRNRKLMLWLVLSFTALALSLGALAFTLLQPPEEAPSGSEPLAVATYQYLP